MNVTDSIGSRHDLVVVNLDHITFHNLTLKQIDTVRFGLNVLVQLQRDVFFNPTVDGIVFEGCKLVGASPFGTQFGIEFGGSVRDITIRGNTFVRLLKAVSGFDGTSNAQGTITIEDNQFLAGWGGSAMEVFGENLIIQRNIIDFNGGFNGGFGIYANIPVSSTRTRIERNLVRGTVAHGLRVQGANVTVIPDSLLIANNMINTSGTTGLSIITIRNAKILFNTVVLRGGGLEGLEVIAQDCIALNNIIIVKPTSGFNVGYDQGNLTSPNLQSDYNVLFITEGNGFLVVRDAVAYLTLAKYRAATGLDTNSISKSLDFVDSTNLHITDCQSQDPELKGIPFGGITVDIDGEIRSTTTPMIGADENSFSGFDMFADPFRAGLSGTAFAIAAGRFDNILFDGLAVPDYDNRQVLLYHNLGNSRSFVQSGTLSTGFRPVIVKFYDIDEDNHLDLIVGGDTSAVQVFWGDGAGGFTTPTTVGTFGRVRSLEPGPIFSIAGRTIAITEDNGFGPTESFLGYLMHLGNRNLCHDVQSNSQGPDTIHATMLDLVVGDLSGDGGTPEIAAVTSSPFPPPLILINGIVFTVVTSGPCADLQPNGIVNEFQLGTAGTTGHSSIVMGDFDGDTDLDLITLETFSSCTFVRNQGNLNFTSEPIPVTGAQSLASMDYENDGDLDLITVNDQLQTNGITVFLNDGTGSFTARENCFFPFATGLPRSVVASDFDQDGKTDIALVSSVAPGVDSLFVLYNLGGGTVGIQDQEIENIPANFSLSQNYPNPFNPSTKIEYTLPAESNVKISVFNILGEKVRELVNNQMSTGTHSVNFNAGNLASGIYVYRIESRSLSGVENFIAVKKMILLK